MVAYWEAVKEEEKEHERQKARGHPNERELPVLFPELYSEECLYIHTQFSEFNIIMVVYLDKIYVLIIELFSL